MNVNKKRKTVNTVIGSAICIVLLLILNITGFTAKCKSIEDRVLRLHIIANSDSVEDQQVKLNVRDELLRTGKEIFDGSITKENATEKLSKKLDFLEQTAQRVIDEKGLDYKANVTIKKEYFTTREYNDFTLPSGNYLSLCVNLGKAEGHNWWCVMFPPLCLPAAENDSEEIYKKTLTPEMREIIENKRKYKIGFKVVEWYNEIKNKVCG